MENKIYQKQIKTYKTEWQLISFIPNKECFDYFLTITTNQWLHSNKNELPGNISQLDGISRDQIKTQIYPSSDQFPIIINRDDMRFSLGTYTNRKTNSIECRALVKYRYEEAKTAIARLSELFVPGKKAGEIKSDDLLENHQWFLNFVNDYLDSIFTDEPEEMESILNTNNDISSAQVVDTDDNITESEKVVPIPHRNPTLDLKYMKPMRITKINVDKISKGYSEIHLSEEVKEVTIHVPKGVVLKIVQK